MSAALRLTAYGAALALLGAAGWATGTAVGPLSSATAAPAAVAHGDSHSGTVAGAHEGHGSGGELPGLASSSRGYTLVPASPTVTGGAFAFTITGSDGAPVTAFDVEHERRMHLIVVRRDTAGFQHVHPEMTPEGTWTVPLALPDAGSYRAFADFTPTGGPATTLGVDVSVPGAFEPISPVASRTAQVDGYTVTLTGELVPGQESPVTLSVARDGAPVTDLEPYLGAYGHLVALRQGDLAYLHVHPQDGPPGPDVPFLAEVPTAGTYRLFLDFSHGGVVRTAEFTVATGPDTAPAPPAEHSDQGAPHTHPEEGR